MLGQRLGASQAKSQDPGEHRCLLRVPACRCGNLFAHARGCASGYNVLHKLCDGRLHRTYRRRPEPIRYVARRPYCT